jgi:hypothetical protein
MRKLCFRETLCFLNELCFCEMLCFCEALCFLRMFSAILPLPRGWKNVKRYEKIAPKEVI